MARTAGTFQRSFIAAAVFAVAATAGFFAVGVLGVATGVLGSPCSTAPAWWEAVYMLLLFLLPPLSGACVASRVYRSFFPRLR